jgi:predicted MFS family arabinose efflux permease
MHQTDPKRATFGEVLRIAEFRAIWIADAQSVAGDQLARVSLAIMVFGRTGSAALTALVYALTYLPAIVGGAFLAGIADHLPRRTVMVCCDLIRAVLFGLAAIPQTPLAVICVLIVLAVLTSSPFAAAESATMPVILAGDRYVVGIGLRVTTGQIAQLAGFAGGGIIVATIGPHWGLAIDALTFAASAVLIFRFVHRRPAPERAEAGPKPAYWRGMLSGGRIVFSDARLRSLVLLAWLAGFYVVPEGLAPSYVAAIGAGSGVVGLLMAADPAGSAVGAGVLVRLVPDRLHARLITPLAVLTGIPLMVFAFEPGVVASLALLVTVGACSAFQVYASTTFMRILPDHNRGHAFGLAQSGLIAVQGLGIAAFGVVADHIGAPRAIGLSGAIGVTLAMFFGLAWERARTRSAAERAGDPARAIGVDR